MVYFDQQMGASHEINFFSAFASFPVKDKKEHTKRGKYRKKGALLIPPELGRPRAVILIRTTVVCENPIIQLSSSVGGRPSS